MRLEKKNGLETNKFKRSYLNMPDKNHNQTTVTEMYRCGHFSSEEEAMGAFKLSYQQAIDGIGISVEDWMGLSQMEYSAWMRSDQLPSKK